MRLQIAGHLPGNCCAQSFTTDESTDAVEARSVSSATFPWAWIAAAWAWVSARSCWACW